MGRATCEDCSELDDGPARHEAGIVIALCYLGT